VGADTTEGAASIAPAGGQERLIGPVFDRS